jgi:hypothetical protein
MERTRRAYFRRAMKGGAAWLARGLWKSAAAAGVIYGATLAAVVAWIAGAPWWVLPLVLPVLAAIGLFEGAFREWVAADTERENAQWLLQQQGDGPREQAIIAAIREGERIHARLLSGHQLSSQAEATDWTGQLIEAAKGDARFENWLSGRDGEEPPHGPEQSAAYVERRLAALRELLAYLRGEVSKTPPAVR